MARIRRFFRLPASERTLAQDIDEEICFHLEERVAGLVAAGSVPRDARAQAEREFGDVALARAELASIDRVTLRRERRGEWWDGVWYDVRAALRGIRRNVAFSLAVVLTLALGIGVNAAMFGITDRLLLSAPMHVTAPDEVVRVLYRHTPEGGTPTVQSVVPYADYTALRAGVEAFRAVAAYSTPTLSVLGRGPRAAELRVIYATASYFPLLGVQPALGRFFTAEEDALPRGARVLVLSHDVWRDRFGGDTAVLGTRVEIDHASYEVIGVAPRGFGGIDLEPVHAWAPVSAVGADRGGDEWYAWRAMYWLRLVARLDSAVGLAPAQQQASAAFVAGDAERFASDTTAGVILGSVIPARAPPTGQGTVQRSGRIALWLLAVSLLVLLIACANVANLLLARGLRRQREIGVRRALGLGRARLVRQVLTETLLLAAGGAVVALLFAHWGGQLARTLLLPDVEWFGGPVGRRVLLFAGAAAAASALLAGLLPALHAARADVGALLALGGRGTGRRSGARRALVAVQAMLSVMLLVGAGLFLRSLQRVTAVPLGYEPERVAIFTWHSTGLDWNVARVQSLYDAGLARVQALPAAEAAAISTTAPMWSAMYGFMRVPGIDSLPLRRDEGPFYASVTPDYFRVMGARIIRGRPFTERDARGSPPVAIVTERLAHLLWPDGEAVGKCFVHLRAEEAGCMEVVGVVEHTRYGDVQADPTAMYYLPLAQQPGFGMRALLVRPRRQDEAGVAPVRRALETLEAGLPHVQVVWLRDRLAPQLQPWRMGASLFTAFGALALLLATLGLYGVVAYDVVQRRRELGVRVALGARAPRLVRLVLGDAVRVICAGLVLGLAAAGWGARYLEPLLFDVAPRDPLVLAAVSALILVSALGAALLPAWRAARIHPTEALRED